MKLTVRDAAKILNVSEKSIYRWIKQGVIPAYQINDQYRFNRAELLEWATSRRINVSPEIFAEPEGGETLYTASCDASYAASAPYRLAGTDKPSLRRTQVPSINIPD